MTFSEAQLIVPSDSESLSVFPMLNIFAKTRSVGGMRQNPIELKLGKMIELFQAAYESYRILTQPDKNETFHKDWTHLEKRWKVANWLWHRLFLIGMVFLCYFVMCENLISSYMMTFFQFQVS